MEDWLNNRLKQFNEEFVQRAAAVVGTGDPALASRLKRTFRPGRWVSLRDAQLEEDLRALFLDDTFPRHMITPVAISRVLHKVSSLGIGDFHIYADIARLPPTSRPPLRALPVDELEAALVEVLHRLPEFPTLRRVRSGVYLFGGTEVELFLRGNELISRSARAGGQSQEMPAEDFFARVGPEEFPLAASMAVQTSGQSPHGAPITVIEPALQTAPPTLPPMPQLQPIPGFPNLPQMTLQTAPGAPLVTNGDVCDLTGGGGSMAPWRPAPKMLPQPHAGGSVDVFDLTGDAPAPNAGVTFKAAAPGRYSPYPAVKPQGIMAKTAPIRPKATGPLGPTPVPPPPVTLGVDDDEI
eukprot:gnl/TRDRNA2_/TRDRNA2_123554_c1_seq1.p1 gnl/TRDRNA2_/TRDRNA2_123554_c1~~gnl/TRDRNA2_/TRDRNA2_123554_c1_seq1.p1  ORF type:complete len:353 (-),score=50.02 gnl/TRDRNA2_/TRDRNA2_123554_c1_seq1:73-1131(-)